MPYFINPDKNQVYVSIGDSWPANYQWIDPDLSFRLKLRHDQVLTAEQVAALLAGSEERFRSVTPGMQPSPQHESIASDARIRQSSLANQTPYTAPTTPVAQQTATRREVVPPSVARASNAAGIVEGVAWVALIVWVIVGILVATIPGRDFNDNVTHPNLGYGIGIAIGGSINCLMIIMVAAYIKAKMELARIGR